MRRRGLEGEGGRGSLPRREIWAAGRGGWGWAGRRVDRAARGRTEGGAAAVRDRSPAVPASPRSRLRPQAPRIQVRGAGKGRRRSPRLPRGPGKRGPWGSPRPLARPGPTCRGGLGAGAGVAELRAARAGRPGSGRVPSCHCDLAERGPDARPCHCFPGSSSREARLQASFLSRFPSFSCGLCNRAPPPSSPRELAGGPPARKVPGGEGWSHVRPLTGRLRTQAVRRASLLPSGPWRDPLRPREYLPRGELCLEDERPLAGQTPRSPGRVGPRRLLDARGPRTRFSRRTRRASPWPRRGHSSWTRTTASGPASSTCRGAASSRCSRTASCSSAWPSPSAPCGSCASTSRGWRRSVAAHLVPAGRGGGGGGGARPASLPPQRAQLGRAGRLHAPTGPGLIRRLRLSAPPNPGRLGVVWEVVAVTVACGVTSSSQLRDRQRCALPSGWKPMAYRSMVEPQRSPLGGA